MKKTFWFTILILYLMGNSSQILAIPCLDTDKIPALPFTGVSVFADCADDKILYVVPEDLNLRASLFSGKKSFTFYEKKDGSAVVKLSLKLLTNSSTVLRVIRALKRDHKKQYRFKPFRIKEVKLTGFSEDDGVTRQKMMAKGSFSDSTFAIQLKLDAEGVELWKESAASDFWEIEPAMLSYKMQASMDGQREWREMAYQINIESLPACTILGENCKDHINRRLAKHGKLFGRLYFHSQYVQCRDLLDKTFEKPSRAEIVDDNLDEAELETVYLFAKDAFNEEYEAQKRDCAGELDCVQGKKWFNEFSSEQKICNLSWRKIKPYLGYRSQKYIDCAKAEYKSVLEKRCKDNRKWDCDGRKGDTRCAGTLKGSSQVCFSPKMIKDNVPFDSGRCSFAVFLKNPDFDIYVLDKFAEARITDARRVPTCVNLSKSVSHLSEIRTRVQCKQ
ncbi:hypothetical protein [Candidatus Parabeggiatoa sp. HSG14]|uniref:hypothetical protein n=1 Tax=Candidatus Parabeggiatoa sp. HSG14 TaxID=3055593 RepID=UPI0025A8C446|nr:hypothetical protein [Thiotrichales bacterium HSG14]